MQLVIRCFTSFVLCLFSVAVYGQQIVKIDGKYALMNTKYEVVSGIFDSIYEKDHFYYFSRQGLMGAVHERKLESTDWSKFSPAYQQLIHLNTSDDLRFAVGLNGKFGVCNSTMELRTPIAYDTVYMPRNWIGSICFVKDGMTAFHPYNAPLVADSLKFVFDQVQATSSWLTSYRQGTKYGFFTRRNMETYTVPPIFDSVPKLGDAFIETWSNGMKTYYYSYDLLSRHNWTQPFQLEVGEGIRFQKFDGDGVFEIAGSRRTEQCILEYYNLLVGTKPGDNLMCIDVSDRIVVDLFQNPTAQETLVPFSYKRGYNSTDSVMMVKIRTPMENNMLRETYISLRNLEELASVTVKDSETTVLKQCEWNYGYIALYIQRENGEIRNPYGFFEIDSTGSFKRTKPMADSYHKRGGGGGSSKRWMDFLWMGGR